MALKTYVTQVNVQRPPFIGPGQWQLSNLHAITVLFGKNGSGKSLLLRGWSQGGGDHVHYVVPERTGDIQFNASYVQNQIEPRERMGLYSSNFAPQYRQHVVARIQAYFLTRGDSRGTTLIGDPAELERFVSMVMPDFAIAIKGKNPTYTLTRTSDGVQITDVTSLSSGEVQVLTLTIDILTMAAMWDIEGAPSRIVLIDEPDAHIHPDLQARFADFLVQVARRFDLQIAVATHSTTLLAALGQFGGDDTGVVYLDRTRTHFSAQGFTSAMKEMAACLGGHALMGPLFGVPLLLVEGDDDYRIWSQVPRHHHASFAVIPCNGDEIKKYQKNLELILGSLREVGQPPAGFALLDGDKALPMASVASPQDHIAFLRLNCHESENLYLTDPVLALMGTDWTTAAEAIVARSVDFGAKAPRLAQARTWDRQRSDIKDLIHEVAQIIDPKRLHWTVRVGHCIGGAVPTGQLLEFLGPTVLTSLWPPPAAANS